MTQRHFLKKTIKLFKNIFHKCINFLAEIGINPYKLYYLLIEFPEFICDYYKLKKQADKSNNDFKFGNFYPILDEKHLDNGNGLVSSHYFHQDLLVARKINLNNPVKHVDIGSRIDGFVAQVASFREIEVLDIRPLSVKIPNIVFKKLNLMDNQTNFYNYCDSISSLHAIEHFGLGRYGDKIDYNGHLSGLDNIYKILKSGGIFYFSVPIGKQRIEFNAHRIFSIGYLLNIFHSKYEIISFSYVNDDGILFSDIALNEIAALDKLNLSFGCGIFELKKI